MSNSIPQQIAAPGVLRMAAAAQYLGVGIGLAEKLAKQNAFPVIRIGERAIGVAREDLDAYIRSRRYWVGGPNADIKTGDTTSSST